VLPADYTFTAADAGSHTFGITLKTAGTQSLTAADTTSSSVTGSQTGIVVTNSFPQDTVGVFDPVTANWYLRSSNSSGTPNAGQFQYGAPGWVAVVGDWNGDGTTTIGVVDPATMTWYLRNENSAGAPDVAAPFRYGLPGWVPVGGDWGGTGHSGIGAYDPSTGTWYLRNEADGGIPDAGVFQYGAPGWLPVVGDWDSDGKTTVGVVDPGRMTWYLRNENSAGAPDVTTPFAYGLPGWKPVAGDWNADGRTGIGVFNPAGTWYLRNTASPGTPDTAPFAYGLGSWTPLSGSWVLPAQGLVAADGAVPSPPWAAGEEPNPPTPLVLVTPAVAPPGGDALGQADEGPQPVVALAHAVNSGWFMMPDARNFGNRRADA
jgi:hypothetical protein